MQEHSTMDTSDNNEINTGSLNEIDENNIHSHQEITGSEPTSYKSMLLGVNGRDNDCCTEEMDMWDEEDDYEEDMQDEDFEDMDPLCPYIPVTTEERKRLCQPWRKAIIIKVLRRRIGYRFLYGRLAKLWSLVGNFELIDLKNDFFLVRFVEITDYTRVLYDGPWMILGHY